MAAAGAAAEGAVRRAVRERLLTEMLGGVQDPVGGGWKALILDEVTTRIMSTALKMSDITDTGVSVVEDLYKGREPLQMAAVYFISPSPAAVARLCADFAKKALYPSVHIFFSSKVSGDAVAAIKKTPNLLPLVRSLKEVNCEFMSVDSRTVVTEQPSALVRVMGEGASRPQLDQDIELAALRLSTLFATLKEFPLIRYRAGKVPEAGDPPGAAHRAMVAQLMATRVTERVMAMQRAGQLPARETCDLIVVDRSVDVVAPLIHEWTYEAMVYDLLHTEGNVVKLSGEGQAKEHILDESDPLWVELRHCHVAEVYSNLSRRVGEFQSKNKAAKVQAGGGGVNTLSASNMRALIAALPQYRDVLSALSLHVSISGELTQATNLRHLTDIGELEQELVYGDKSSSELIKYLQEHGGDALVQDKQRLLGCYVATHPEKLDPTKAQQWQTLSRIQPRDMGTVINLQYLGCAVMKTAASASKGLSFGLKKKGAQKATRAKRPGRPESIYSLRRFDPLLLDILEDAANGKLSQDEFPYVRPPEQNEFGLGTPEELRVASARTNKSNLKWARRGPDSGFGSASGPGSPLNQLSSQMGSTTLGGRRLVVFVIGGVTRSEMRAAHQASQQLGRDVVLVSTSVLRPDAFLSQLEQMGPMEAL